MSNPAIVLMTDPSRCSLGDVHYLVQALLEIQQMGEHAIPQAFCDHPEAARDFIDAYAHAYPQLLLEDREIPTPDHLHSLISTGQVGALARPTELARPRDLQSPDEPTAANGVPIVMLTMGGSQALLDALQQTPAIRESIRLIDVGPEKADALSVSVADAVATRGLDSEPWQQERSRPERLELDNIPRESKLDLTSLALQDDQMSLDVVEAAKVAHRDPEVYDAASEPEPAPTEPPATGTRAAAPAEERAGSASPDDARAGSSATETGSEPANQAPASRPSERDPAEPGDDETVESEEQSLELEAQGDPVANGGSAPAGHAANKEGVNTGGASKGDKKADEEPDEEVDAAEKGGKGAPEQDDDVCYPPVGTLLAGADVLYPALDRGGTDGALHELANVLMDDGILDCERASEFIEAQRSEGLPAPDRQDVLLAVRESDNVVTLEDVYAACDQESDDELADADVARPLHDSDL